MKTLGLKNRLLSAAVVLTLAIGAPMAMAQSDSLPETDPVVTARVAQWQNLKFGLMIHWGIYSQWQVVESWSICNEPWIVRNQLGPNGPIKGREEADYVEYKRAYQALNKTFNPRHFAPQRWAEAAKKAGMKYVVFTTKHHDGISMFDSKFTDYTSAGPDCPARRDFTRELVDAFRSAGFWTGLYFSKPDWHHPDYWAREWATPDRNVNYDIATYPERWARFKDFTYNQIYELTHNYGDIDILWLDGGWVRPEWSLNDESLAWLGCSRRVQDIDMPRIVRMARSNNPDLIVVDRSVGGRYENYRTPEQTVPDKPLGYPWETCMSMGDSWSYVSDDNYKSTATLIHTLVDVVAKGGSFLLNIGPDADCNLPPEALQRLEEIGDWLSANGYAIYGTRPLKPYVKGNRRYTQSADGRRRFEITLTPNYPYATVREM